MPSVDIFNPKEHHMLMLLNTSSYFCQKVGLPLARRVKKVTVSLNLLRDFWCAVIC